MTVIKRRPDGKIPCKTDDSDDSRFWKEIAKKIDCLPSYWKNTGAANFKLKPCVDMTQLKWVDNVTTRNRHIKDEISSLVETACNEFVFLHNK